MTRLTVAVRVRPLSEREITNKSVSIVSVDDGKTIAVTNTKVPEQNAGDSRERVRRFHFDYCFNYAASQEDVYRRIGAEIVGSVRTRVHSCILAYGQSASGKTHTMLGDAAAAAADDDAEEGVVPRMCRQFFDYLDEVAIGSEREQIHARVSFLEIYNERVRDLLNHEASLLLKVREHPKTGPYVQGLSEQSVSNAEALVSLLHAGNANRTIGATNANPRSSRSHSVFTITCLGGLKLKFVDLAGSERATAGGGGAHTASRFREGANINKSLVALRNVISALADWSKLSKVKKRFVPYRDSVLTWLLKDTLGGNSKTILISTVSPASTCYNETVNTLRFGQRAKQIAIQPLLNEDPKERTIRELRAEISKLRELLLLNNVNKPIDEPSNTLEENGEDNKHEESDKDNDSDSGISVTQDKPKLNQVNTVTCSDIEENYVEKIYPLIDVTATKMAEGKPKSLQRTFSVDQSVEPPKKPTTPRKLSTDKSNLSLRASTLKKVDPKPKVDTHRKVTPKPRSQIVAAVTQRLYNKVKKKDVGTDTLDLSLAVPLQELSITSKARFRLQELTQKALKAHRRKNAETQTSLFPVLRFKEACTDVDDLRFFSEQVANIDTATDAILLCDAATNCTFLETLQSLSEDDKLTPVKQSTIVFTRSCGTLTDPYIETWRNQDARKFADEKTTPSTSSLSFTKYLMPQQAQPTFEIVNPATANPIYTSSVNINVNHNYTTVGVGGASPSGGKTHAVDALSDDSLELPSPTASPEHGNVCFPTPDLISNHNSLEQTCTNLTNKHSYDTSSATTTTTAVGGCDSENMRYAISTAMPIEETPISLSTNSLNSLLPCTMAVASCSMAMDTTHRVSAHVQTQFAPEMCVGEVFDDDYDIFYKAPPQKYRSNIAHDQLHDPLHPHAPTILKSIMKCSDDFDDGDEPDVHMFENIPDSLNYYYEKERKTVRFDSPTSSSSTSSSTSTSSRHKHRHAEKDERMMDVMTGFMKEVTTLMTNLSKVANRLDTSAADNIEHELNYDLQVIVNGIDNLSNCNHCNKCECTHNQVHLPTRDIFTESTQTLPISTSDCSTSTATGMFDDFEEIPVNKFEALLESSCKRLEGTVQRTLSETNERRDVFGFRHAHLNPHDFYRNAEDSSLESQPTFSDYGSLPRRRNRVFSSPSSYLRQLTNMRREIVRTSRDELLQEADLHL